MKVVIFDNLEVRVLVLLGGQKSTFDDSFLKVESSNTYSNYDLPGGSYCESIIEQNGPSWLFAASSRIEHPKVFGFNII